jgi:hypothetical protein
MSHCESCGTRLVEFGICNWCHEELYINDIQMSEHPISVSDEWRETVGEQREEHKRRQEQRK